MQFLKKNWLTITLAVIIAVLLFWNVDNKELADSYRLEKEKALQEAEDLEDSVMSVLKENKLSIELARQEIQKATIETRDAKAEADKYREKYENLKFVNRTTDAERADALKRLYPK